MWCGERGSQSTGGQKKVVTALRTGNVDAGGLSARSGGGSVEGSRRDGKGDEGRGARDDAHGVTQTAVKSCVVLCYVACTNYLGIFAHRGRAGYKRRRRSTRYSPQDPGR